jgi:hypothetical protein
MATLPLRIAHAHAVTLRRWRSLSKLLTAFDGAYGSGDMEKMLAAEIIFGVPECERGATEGKVGFFENGKVARR